MKEFMLLIRNEGDPKTDNDQMTGNGKNRRQKAEQDKIACSF